MKRRIKVIGALLALAALPTLLVWPAGTWVQGREYRPGPDFVPDAVYLVAGEQEQVRRAETMAVYLESVRGGKENISIPVLMGMEALRDLCPGRSDLGAARRKMERLAADAEYSSARVARSRAIRMIAATAATDTVATTTATDTVATTTATGTVATTAATDTVATTTGDQNDRYYKSNGRGCSSAHFARAQGDQHDRYYSGDQHDRYYSGDRHGRYYNLVDVAAAVSRAKTWEHKPIEMEIHIVPGRYYGTDAEMECLAEYLRKSNIGNVVLVTSAFHARRCARRLRHHAGPEVSVYAVGAPTRAHDRRPWVVAGELVKMFRDEIGLSRAAFVSRRFYVRSIGPARCIAVVCAALMVYAWIAYPLILRVAARRIGRRRAEEGKAGDVVVGVTVLLSAHNEESVIAARLINLMEAGQGLAERGIDYSVELGLDACADGTRAAAERIAGARRNIRIHDFKERRGKVAALKDLVLKSDVDNRKSRILLFTDANTRFLPGSIERLIGHFNDPEVGGVCGRLVFGIEDSASAPTLNPHTHILPHSRTSPESRYWEWERKLKEHESALDSCLGANGAIYAVRSDLFPPDVPDNTIVDDFVIGMKVRERGYRMVYEPGAVAEEPLPPSGSEWARRVRIGAGDYQALWLCRKCLTPKFGRFAWMFWSHKVLRWFTPHALLALAAIAVCRQWSTVNGEWLIGRWIGAGIAVLLVFALAGRLLRNTRSLPARPFRLCAHFVSMQAALFAGFIRFCRGNLEGAWDRTPRGGG